MTSRKPALITRSARTDSPRRETLRSELARTKPTGRRAGLKPKLVLASASPRRLMLLGQVGIEPDALRPPPSTRQPYKGEMPRSLVTPPGARQGRDARATRSPTTRTSPTPTCWRPTPSSRSAGASWSSRASSRRSWPRCSCSRGATIACSRALCLITPDDRVRLKIVDTRVRFKRLSKEEIEAYIASREWRGKAGGYAIQGLAGCFVQKLTGSYTNVVGLPLTEVVGMLLGEGFPIHFNWLKLGEADPE